jgi:hypothetical protein
LVAAGLESSIGEAERVFLSVRELVAKVQSIVGHVRDMVVSDSTSTTIASIVNVLAPKGDGEDPMNAVVRKQVMT